MQIIINIKKREKRSLLAASDSVSLEFGAKRVLRRTLVGTRSCPMYIPRIVQSQFTEC